MSRVFLLARFPDAEALFAGARKARELGFADVDCHSPYPLHGADEAMGLKKSRVPMIVLIGGLTGATLGYLMQWWMNAVDFPINVGGRPVHSPPTNIPVTFECGILCAVLCAFFGALALIGLPKPYHPVFDVEAFRRASIDQLWLSVASETEFPESVAAALTEVGALETTISTERE